MRKMKKCHNLLYIMLICVGIYSTNAFSRFNINPILIENKETICERTKQVQEAIKEALNIKDCNDIHSEDLLKFKGILFLNDKEITKLKTFDFKGLANLQWIDLSGNQLTILPNDVFQGLEKLQRIYLSYNKFTTLPDNVFLGLEKLQRIYLSYPVNPLILDTWS